MGKIKNVVKADMYKVFTGATFWCAVVAVVLIELLGNVSIDVNKVGHNVIDIVINYSTPELRDIFIDEINVKSIIFRGSSGYLWMFAPVLAGLPLIPLLCAERKNKAMRYELCRVGKNKFVISKLISASLSGGMVMAFGYGIFCLIVYLIVPDKGAPAGVLPEFLEMTAEIHPWMATVYLKYGFAVIVAMKLLLFFAYGAVSSMMAYALTSFITNKYIVLCVPYMVNYIVCMFSDRQSMKQSFWEKPQTYIDVVFGLKQNTFVSLYNRHLSELKTFLIMQLLLALGCLVFYSVIIRKRCDCGQ